MVVRGPANIGDPHDYRVPDVMVSRDPADRTWYPTAAIVVEVVSPGDESRRKDDFYHRVGVEEILIVDPDRRTLEWYVRGVDSFAPSAGSAVLGLASAEMVVGIDWPER
jgi:Uma2 family endonuclease